MNSSAAFAAEEGAKVWKMRQKLETEKRKKRPTFGKAHTVCVHPASIRLRGNGIHAPSAFFPLESLLY